MVENEITGDILDAAIKVHRKFGPGVLINFGMEKLVDGYVRVVNGFNESTNPST